MKKCKFCQIDEYKVETDSVSYNKGFIQLYMPESHILFIKNDEEEFIFSINYCPYCGNKLRYGNKKLK